MTAPRTTRSLIRLAAAGTAVVLLTGCGSSDDSGAEEEPSTSASSSASTTQSPSTTSPSESSSTSAGSAPEETTVTLDAPDTGEHKPTIHKGQGDAVIAIRHHPADAPVRTLIINKGAADFSAKVQSGPEPDSQTLHDLSHGTHEPLRLGADATTIRITSNGHWLVKLLPHD